MTEAGAAAERAAETATGGHPYPAPGQIEVVLFDIGGVLAPFAGLARLREMIGGAGDAETANRWLLSPWVASYESGQCEDEEFAAGVVAEFDLPFTPSQFLDEFLGWLGDPFDGAEQMLRDAAAGAAVGCLSNTNALHWRRRISHWSLMSLLQYPFLSFQLGAVKPGVEIFERVLAQLPVTGEQVLFLDDNALNVQGARAAGLNAEQALGVAAAREALARHGVLAG